MVFSEEKKRIEVMKRRKGPSRPRQRERDREGSRRVSGQRAEVMNYSNRDPKNIGHRTPLHHPHRCFLALALTRASNTALAIIVCAV